MSVHGIRVEQLERAIGGTRKFKRFPLFKRKLEGQINVLKEQIHGRNNGRAFKRQTFHRKRHRIATCEDVYGREREELLGISGDFGKRAAEVME